MTTLDLDLDYQQIRVGAEANDDTGATFRTAGILINQNARRSLNNLTEVNRCVSELRDALSIGDGGIVEVVSNLVVPAGRVVAATSAGLVIADSTLANRPFGITSSAGTMTSVNVRISGVIDLATIVSGTTYYLGASGVLRDTAPSDNVYIIGRGIAPGRLLVEMSTDSGSGGGGGDLTEVTADVVALETLTTTLSNSINTLTNSVALATNTVSDLSNNVTDIQMDLETAEATIIENTASAVLARRGTVVTVPTTATLGAGLAITVDENGFLVLVDGFNGDKDLRAPIAFTLTASTGTQVTLQLDGIIDLPGIEDGAKYYPIGDGALSTNRPRSGTPIVGFGIDTGRLFIMIRTDNI